MTDLKGKTALITGATSGIGRATALALADRGAHVLVTGRNEQRAADLTAEIARFVDAVGAKEGTVTLFIRHTSASLTIQENADPTVLLDLTTALDRLAPEGAGWRHDTEGPDDMPAHVRSMLTATSLQIPVLKRELALGTWQAIYLIEHRRRPHAREIVLQFTGSTA